MEPPTEAPAEEDELELDERRAEHSGPGGRLGERAARGQPARRGAVLTTPALRADARPQLLELDDERDAILDLYAARARRSPVGG